MIWCFGFFFLELLDDFDEKSNNDDALASLDDADRNWAAIPTPSTLGNSQEISVTNNVYILVIELKLTKNVIDLVNSS